MSFSLIDNHIHGSFGVNFNNATYDEIKFVLAKLYERNIKGICPTLVGDENLNIQKQLSIFKKIKNEQMKNLNSEVVERCNIKVVKASQAKSGVNTYLSSLYAFDPTTVGNSIPNDDFYHLG